MSAHYELKSATGGQFMFNLKAANGETAWIRYMIVYERGAPNVGYKGWREAAAHVIGVFPPKNRDPRFGQ